jgi:hypothetical protein
MLVPYSKLPTGERIGVPVLILILLVFVGVGIDAIVHPKRHECLFAAWGRNGPGVE